MWLLIYSLISGTGADEDHPYSDIVLLLSMLPLWRHHCNYVIMSAMASQITSLTIVYSRVYSGADQRKHQSSASLAIVRGTHRWPVNSPHNAENVSIWWRHNDDDVFEYLYHTLMTMTVGYGVSPLFCRGLNIPEEMDQYFCCCCTGSLRPRALSSHNNHSVA